MKLNTVPPAACRAMADIPIACKMHRWWGLPLQHADHPHLRRWHGGIRHLPAARGVLDLPLS